MAFNPFFDTEENRTLTAICTCRTLIRNIGIGGIVWGVFNILFGFAAIQVTRLNEGLLILGVLMLGIGICAVKKPSLKVVLIETIVAGFICLWSAGISIFNLFEGEIINSPAKFISLVAPCILINYYRKLRPLCALVESMDSEKTELTIQSFKAVLEKDATKGASIIQTTNRKCRVQLMGEQAFFVQRNLARAFVCPKEAVQGALFYPEKNDLRLGFEHPQGTLIYQFDRKSSDKLKSWLSEKTGTHHIGEQH